MCILWLCVIMCNSVTVVIIPGAKSPIYLKAISTQWLFWDLLDYLFFSCMCILWLCVIMTVMNEVEC